MAEVLLKKGYKALDVRDIGLRGASDEDILKEAFKAKATLITADVGFASLVYLSSTRHFGLILLRVPNYYSIYETNNLLIRVVNSLIEDDIMGNIVVITPDKVRIKKSLLLERTSKGEKNSK